MADTVQHDPRLRRVTPNRWAAWASRLLLALLFAVGMVGARSRPLVESEPGPTVEISEDGEAVAREEQHARIARRHAAQPRGRWARALAFSRPPLRLEPTVALPTPPRWQRPRRAPPPDDDDTSMG